MSYYTDSSPGALDDKTHKGRSTAVKEVMFEGLIADAHLQDQNTSSSNASSQKSDFDSVGQDMARSMMTLLLPQAVPLLKKDPRKKETSTTFSETCFDMDTPDKKGERAMDPTKYMAVHIEGTDDKGGDTESVIPCSDCSRSLVPDSFEDNQSDDHPNFPSIPCSDIAEADHLTSECTSPYETLQGLARANNSSIFDIKTSTDKNDGNPALEELERSVHLPKNEDSITSAVAETSRSATQAESLVYSRRKSRKTSIFSGPTCDKIKVRNKGDDCVLETNLPTGTVIFTAVNREGSKREISATEGRFEEQCFDLHKEVTAMTSNHVSNAKASHSPEDQACVCASQDKDHQNGHDLSSPLIISNQGCISSNIETKNSFEVIIRNKGDDSVLETNPTVGTINFTAVNEKQNRTDSSFPEGRLEEQCSDLHKGVTVMTSNHVLNTKASLISEDQDSTRSSEDRGQQNGNDLSPPLIRGGQGCISCNIKAENSFNTYISSPNQVSIENKPYCSSEVQVSLDMEPQQDVEPRNKLGEPFQLLGCYFHPRPVISLLLVTNGVEIYVSVLCGTMEENRSTLFIYKVASDERTGSPTFIGHSSLILPSLRDNEGRQVATARSGLQFTPDGQFLVLLDSIKVPYCREQDINCLCSTCASTSFTENAVKVVKVNFGYASLVKKLEANDCLHSILVCGLNHIVAIGESGRLHTWVMNLTWSAQTEEFVLPAYDCNSPCIVEAMKIPKSAVLVLGYNGFGEFSVWNITSRICLSKFSSAKTSICQFFPVGVFNWNSINPPSSCDLKEHVNGVLPSIIQQSDNYDCRTLKEKDVAIWTLVSTTPNSDAQVNKCIPSSGTVNPAAGWWRLALLVKDTMILGGTLDPRATSVGISSGHGVIGTRDGLAYIWELSTGARLGSLHHFKGSSVSCIAADESGLDILAVASDGGHLLLYKHS